MADKQDEDKRAKWEQPEIEDFQEDCSGNSEGCGEDERVVVGTYQKGCYPMPYGFGVCNPRKGMCYPRKGMYYPYGYGFYPWYIYCAPRYGCYPYGGYYSGHATYCRPYGFNYGYGCYPRR